MRAVLRRYAAESPAIAGGAEGERLSFEGGVLDIMRREFIAADGAGVDLTAAEFALLELFLRRPQRVLSRDEIMNLHKGHDWSPFDRSVDSAIARLRKKVEADAERPKYIKTVRGVGYVFAGDVRRL